MLQTIQDKNAINTLIFYITKIISRAGENHVSLRNITNFNQGNSNS